MHSKIKNELICHTTLFRKIQAKGGQNRIFGAMGHEAVS